MTKPWMLDELAHAGPEHLDPSFAAGFDRKHGYPNRMNGRGQRDRKIPVAVWPWADLACLASVRRVHKYG
ncbi:MAG TPA: hypothetical protein VF933_29210 [Streptosporangiaceae bacterium]